MTADRGRYAELVDTATPILVLRRSVGSLQHCVLAVARSAGRLGIPVDAVRGCAREPALRSRYLRNVLALRPDAPEEEFVEGLLAIGERLERAVLLPIDDLASVLVGDHQQRLAECFRLPLAPLGVQRRLASKRELFALCQSLDLPTPTSSFPADETELLAQAEGQGYPVVLKQTEPWLNPRDLSAPSVAIVRDREALLNAYTRMESELAPQVMVQQYIPGDADSVWMVNGYTGVDSEFRCAFTGQKLRQRGPRTGPTSLGVCVRNDEVIALAGRLLRAIGYRGIVDMGFRHDRRDGSYKLLDVNPRLGSTFRLFAGADGLDVVRAMHLDLTGRPVPATTVLPGRKWIDERNDLVTSVRMLREGSLGPRRWAADMRGIQEGAWWAADDPLPFLGMSTLSARQTAQRLTGRGRA